MFKKHTMEQLFTLYQRENDYPTGLKVNIGMEIIDRITNAIAMLGRAETASDAKQIYRRFLEPENGG